MIEQFISLEDIYVQTRAGKVHALISKSTDPAAETYVLVHGLLVSASYMEPTARVLAQRNNVIVPDILGHGKSDTPDTALNIDEHAAVLAEFLQNLNVQNPILVGGSYGCNISAELAAIAEVEAKALILLGPTDVHGRPVHALIGDLIKDGFFEPAIMVPTVLGDITRIGIDRCLKQLEYMAYHDMDDALLRSDIPILLIKGEHDQLSNEDLVRDKFDIVPKCHAVNLIGSAHCLSVSDPELIAHMIEDFVRKGDLHEVYRAA